MSGWTAWCKRHLRPGTDNCLRPERSYCCLRPARSDRRRRCNTLPKHFLPGALHLQRRCSEANTEARTSRKLLVASFPGRRLVLCFGCELVLCLVDAALRQALWVVPCGKAELCRCNRRVIFQNELAQYFNNFYKPLLLFYFLSNKLSPQNWTLNAFASLKSERI